MLCDDLLCPFKPNITFLYQLRRDLFDEIAARTRRTGHLPRVQRHMSSLNTLRGQGPDGGEILRQPYTGDDLRQFTRGVYA